MFDRVLSYDNKFLQQLDEILQRISEYNLRPRSTEVEIREFQEEPIKNISGSSG